MSGRSHPNEALDYAAAVPEDAAACIALRGRTRENAIPAERLADAGITTESWAHDIRTGALPGCVCREAGRMLGYCFGSVSDGEIVVLAVLPEAEQRGIGRALLSRVIDALAAAGRTRLFLGCSPDPLHRSHGFYRHLGWRSTGRFDRHGDELLEYHVRRLVLREADPQGQDALDRSSLASAQQPTDTRTRRVPGEVVTLRPYVPADWPRLCAIHDAARRHELQACGLEAAFLSLKQTAEHEGLFDGDVIVAEADGQVRGFAAHAAGELTWLYVDPANYRQGVGRRLLREALRACGGNLSAEVLVGNDAALQLYLAEGFRVVRRVDGRLAGNGAFAASGYVLQCSPARLDDVVYRAGLLSDARCLAALALHVFLDTYAPDGIDTDLAEEALTVYSPAALETRLRDPAVAVTLALHGERLIAFMDVSLDSACPVAGIVGHEVHRLYLHRRFQRRGLGRALLQRAEATAREAGAAQVWLTAWSGNAGALAFYRRAGYADVGTTDYVIAGRRYENRVLAKTVGRTEGAA